MHYIGNRRIHFLRNVLRILLFHVPVKTNVHVWVEINKFAPNFGESASDSRNKSMWTFHIWCKLYKYEKCAPFHYQKSSNLVKLCSNITWVYFHVTEWSIRGYLVISVLMNKTSEKRLCSVHLVAEKKTSKNRLSMFLSSYYFFFVALRSVKFHRFSVKFGMLHE